MKRYINNKRGSVIVIVALIIVALLGFTALAVEIGLLSHHKSKLQNACDAAALAGARKLMASQSEAELMATLYAENNGVKNGVDGDTLGINVNITDSRIEVTASRMVPLTLAKVLGISESKVSARAVASLIPPNESRGIRPFGVTMQDGDADGLPDPLDDDDDNDGILDIDDEDDDNDGILDIDEDMDNDGIPDILDDDIDGDGILNGEDSVNFITGQQVILKLGTGTGYHGNFKLLALDGRGNILGDNILYGSDGTYEIGQLVDTEPGQNIGNVKNEIQQLIDECTDGCTYTNYTSNCSRVIIVPIIESMHVNGREEVKIIGFAKLFLEAYDNSTKAITGYFIEDVILGSGNATGDDYGVKTITLID